MKPKIYTIRTYSGWQWAIRLDGNPSKVMWEIAPQIWVFDTWREACELVRKYWDAVGGYRRIGA